MTYTTIFGRGREVFKELVKEGLIPYCATFTVGADNKVYKVIGGVLKEIDPRTKEETGPSMHFSQLFERKKWMAQFDGWNKG